ncbi:MAG TPA: bifunctional 5,10-methylenetetrahydrofolate dehydrogenase/5,10-methenyltetrahydrofolate cyclohydrolase [Ktedonobacterales bacterium]
MSARILEGRPIAEALRTRLKRQAIGFQRRAGRPATIAVLHVGTDDASLVYARAIERTALQLGLESRAVELPAQAQESDLVRALVRLSDDRGVDGILVQLPLPRHLSQRTIAEMMDPRKDVDGISVTSVGNLFLRQQSLVPSTPAAVVSLLDHYRVPLSGKRVVIVGASNVVGKPLAFLLLQRDATVTVCHIATRDLAMWTQQAEVLVVAVGKPHLIHADMVRPGATVIDVGINTLPDRSIVGDVDFETVREVAGAITPVPGGIGQLTNIMVLRQTLLAALLQLRELV